MPRRGHGSFMPSWTTVSMCGDGSFHVALDESAY